MTIVYADAEGVIRVWNRGATRVFGFAEAEAVGRPLDIVVPENLRERHWQGYRATMRTGQYVAATARSYISPGCAEGENASLSSSPSCRLATMQAG